MKVSEIKIWNTKLIKSKINKYECLKGEEILPFDQSQIMQQVKFIYSPHGKLLKNTKYT